MWVHFVAMQGGSGMVISGCNLGEYCSQTAICHCRCPLLAFPHAQQPSRRLGMETWTARSASDETMVPTGERPIGLLVLTADGWMSAHVAARDRPNFSGSNPRGEPAEREAAFATYWAYARRYRLDGDRLITKVEGDSIPNLRGTEQARDVELTEDVLILRAPLRPGESHELRWRRI